MDPPTGDDSWIAGDIQGLYDIFTNRICLQGYQLFMSQMQEDKAYVELPHNPKSKVPSCWSEVYKPAVQFLYTLWLYII